MRVLGGILILSLLGGCGQAYGPDLPPAPTPSVSVPSSHSALQKQEYFEDAYGVQFERFCVDGLAFARVPTDTSTLRIPEWDATFCGTVTK